jgi:hypothetical protein
MTKEQALEEFLSAFYNLQSVHEPEEVAQIISEAWETVSSDEIIEIEFESVSVH